MLLSRKEVRIVSLVRNYARKYGTYVSATDVTNLFALIPKSFLKFNLIQGLRPEIPSSLNPVLWSLMEGCWELLPEKRPPFSSILHTLIEVFEYYFMPMSGL